MRGVGVGSIVGFDPPLPVVTPSRARRIPGAIQRYVDARSSGDAVSSANLVDHATSPALSRPGWMPFIV